MSIPSITPLPPAPSRGDNEATFTSQANAFVAALPTLVTEINTVGDAMETTLAAAQLAETNAETAEANAEAAAAGAAAAVQAELEDIRDDTLAYRNEAEGFKDDAESAALASASSANFKGSWSSLTGALSKPASVYHTGSHWNLLNNLADVALSEPTAGNSDWAKISTGLSGLTSLTASGTLVVNSINSVDATGDFVFVVPSGTANGDVIKVKRNGFGGANAFTGVFRNAKTSLIVRSWNYTLELTWSASRSLWIYE